MKLHHHNRIFAYAYWMFFVLPTVVSVNAFTAQDPQSSKAATRVLVTGAAGKTGRLILSKLEKDPRYEPKGLVRSEKSAYIINKK